MRDRPVPLSVLVWAAVLGLIQGFDVGVHVASGQLEPLRVAASLLVTVWAIVAVVRRDAARRTVVVAALGAYLALNAVFLALEGVTNPAQDGAVRWMLFALVATTTIAVLSVANRRAAEPVSRPA
ncbi:MAG: hypothetical protein ABR510_12950 [Trueperaceae bacterium]